MEMYIQEKNSAFCVYCILGGSWLHSVLWFVFCFWDDCYLFPAEGCIPRFYNGSSIVYIIYENILFSSAPVETCVAGVLRLDGYCSIPYEKCPHLWLCVVIGDGSTYTVPDR